MSIRMIIPRISPRKSPLTTLQDDKALNPMGDRPST